MKLPCVRHTLTWPAYTVVRDFETFLQRRGVNPDTLDPKGFALWADRYLDELKRDLQGAQ